MADGGYLAAPAAPPSRPTRARHPGTCSFVEAAEPVQPGAGGLSGPQFPAGSTPSGAGSQNWKGSGGCGAVGAESAGLRGLRAPLALLLSPCSGGAEGSAEGDVLSRRRGLGYRLRRDPGLGESNKLPADAAAPGLGASPGPRPPAGASRCPRGTAGDQPVCWTRTFGRIGAPRKWEMTKMRLEVYHFHKKISLLLLQEHVVSAIVGI
ncbi:collagen alpha-2(I) chain-like isoform X1 [Canis lupus familiaris]|uniref:collagen alpha-2(I) chain-like isoform X1 n=1 Tax=Canis lupus familiaris TaxID=9615 RepID=UPI0018F2F60A|nr:collagen alpha-2(I) chain-like isoform X1 [Canis lupus familiaris]XP_038426437.1 collagen alpha-2(I) chain-like isoform X1 [Canis lupus familiaris]XP_048956088.1 collagen alpha-2(I) chain-like isoform X2 [Canis lupus dingo]